MWEGEVYCECRPTPEEIQARKDRIAVRRARIDAKIALENAGNEEPLSSVPSSLDLFLGGEEGDEATKKGKKGGDAFDQLESHIEQSRKNLEQILIDGDTMVTNVKVAAEFREKDRHDRLEEEKKERYEKLQAEADECEEMYKEIEKNWMISAEKVLPLELYEKIQVQQKACEEILEKRQDLIEDLKQGIDDNDWEFEHNLEMYQKDIMLMGDRIDDLVERLRDSFVEELQLIEDYTAFDREQMLERNQKEWKDLMEKYEEMESNNIEERQADALRRFDALGDIYNDVKEETKFMRKAMENDLRNLQLELEHIKFATVLNMEKLEYNLEVLRRREVENLKMKNSMKRLLLKLQDRFNARAQALKDQIDKARKENEKIIKEIRRLEFLNRDAKRKTLHVVATDYHRFMDLWVLHEEEARDKLQRLLESERYILEGQLGVKVPEAALSELDNRPLEVHCFINKVEYIPPPGSGDENARNSDVQVTARASRESSSGAERTGSTSQSRPTAVPKTGSSLVLEPTGSNEFIPGPDPDPLVQRRLMKHITKVICDQTGFVIEDKLRKILAPMEPTERMLIHFDAVLQALGIHNISEMQVLARYMLRRCTVMRGIMSKMGSSETPVLESMQVSLEGIPGGDGTDDEAGLQRLRTALMQSLAQVAEVEALEGADEEDQDAALIGIIMPRTLARTASTDLSSENEITEIPPSAERILSAIALEGMARIVQVHLPPSEVEIPRVRNIPSDGNLTPVSVVSDPSLEGIIETFASDTSLKKVLQQVEKKRIRKGFPPILDSDSLSEGSPCSCASPSSHGSIEAKPKDSLVTDKAEVLTWMKMEEGFEETAEEDQAYLEEGGEEFDGEDEDEFGVTAPGQKVRRKVDKPLRRASLEGDDSDYSDETKTLSIPSHPSTPVGSDEFLYIEPNDVLHALAEFCKDYNAKIKIELPTEDQRIDAKLAKLRFPSPDDVSNYWDKFIYILQPKSPELWDAALFCFEEYGKLLAQRNQYVKDIRSIYQQNTELSQLLKTHMMRNPRANLNMNTATLPYC